MDPAGAARPLDLRLLSYPFAEEGTMRERRLILSTGVRDKRARVDELARGESTCSTRNSDVADSIFPMQALPLFVSSGSIETRTRKEQYDSLAHESSYS